MIRFSTAGESHGEALIALVSGLPAGIPIDLDFVNRELWRRQQGYGRGGRMKIETDKVHILSGVRHGNTIGLEFCQCGAQPIEIGFIREQCDIAIAAKLRRAVQHAGLTSHQQVSNPVA